MKNKPKIEFLDIVLPFTFIYTAVICFKTYFINGDPQGSFKDMIILTCISFVLMHGLFGLVKGIKDFGWTYLIKFWRYFYNK